MFSLLIIFILLFLAPDKKLRNTPKRQNAIQFVELFTLNTTDGFYEHASASYSNNGKTIVLDAGNRRVHIYDKLGKQLKIFGKEGSGPGEFSSPFKVFTTTDQIFVRDETKVSAFDFNGNQLRDYSLIVAGSVGTPIIHNNQLAVYFSDEAKYLYVVFDANGKLIIKKENKQYESPKTDGLHFMRQSDFKLASYDQGFIKLFKGSYRFAFLDDQMNETNAYIKDYERVKRDFSVYDMAVDEDKKSKEEIAREKQKMRQAMMKMLGEYVDDLTSILGFDANKLYIRAAVPNSQTLKVDVIENGEYYTQITLENRDSFNEARIVNGKLLICYENDTVGPFVKVFDIKSI